MNRRVATYTILGLLLIAVVVWLVQQNNRRFSWRETYRIESKEPYGCFAIYQLLQDYTPAKSVQPLTDSVAGQLPLDMLEGPANYVFIGEGMYMRTEDLDDLLAFVGTGHSAFISCKVLPYDLMFHLYYNECAYEPWDDIRVKADTSISLNFAHPAIAAERDYEYTFINAHEATATYWPYIGKEYFCDLEEGLVPIGFMEDSLINFAKVPYGEGTFYLHTTPQVFTNFFVVNPAGREYASRALSHLNPGPIYWDKYSGVPDEMARRNNDIARNVEPERRLYSESPLQFILEQPPLAWAWYLLVVLALIYMLFRTRRRQRVIPIVDPNRNTSLQFLQTIGWLYYQKSSHQQVAVQAIKLWRTHVWDRYGLQWRHDDEQCRQQLIARSGLDAGLIDAIAKDVRNIPRYTGLVEGELVKFHRRLEQFYGQAK